MSAIVLDFNQELTSLDGKPIMDLKMKQEDPDVPVLINKMLANNISQSPKGGMKEFHWSLDLWESGKLILDKADRDQLRATIDGMQISLLVRGRCTAIIDNAEKAAEKQEEEEKAKKSKALKAS